MKSIYLFKGKIYFIVRDLDNIGWVQFIYIFEIGSGVSLI